MPLIFIRRKPCINFSKFIFVYLLGTSTRQRKKIIELAKKMNLTIVTVPYAAGVYNLADNIFGDVKLNYCSPQEWIWLIRHAEYIITDSFHGCVFSTIFSKKFIVVKRMSVVDINNRMVDYLNTINETDKMTNFENTVCLDELVWDYEKINELLRSKIDSSKKYLELVLKDDLF